MFNFDNTLVHKISDLIENSQKQVVQYANSTLTILFWQVGKLINENMLQQKRADYGKQVVVSISNELESKYGKNFTEKNVRRMMQFAEIFSDFEIVVTLSRQLSWSHFLLLIPLKSGSQVNYYSKIGTEERLSVRQLREKINQKAFERKELANIQIKSDIIPQDTFKDPYLLNFLGLEESFLEKDLENAILNKLEKFILELGSGFAFIERQKRMVIDGEDFYLDLLFFHRKLKRLIAIELKVGKFNARDKGQMELYLKWLEKYEKQNDENTPIGLILCAETNREQIELLDMQKDGILVAEFWTEFMPKKALEEKLHTLLIEARERIEISKI